MAANSSTSNSKINTALKTIVVLGLVALGFFQLNKVGEIYAEKEIVQKVNTWNAMRFEELYALGAGSLDMVFIGSSHSYCTFEPDYFDRELGKLSQQMGMPLQHADGSYFTLLEVFNYQKPQTVVMELYWDMLDSEYEPSQLNSLFSAMDNEELKTRFMQEAVPLSVSLKSYLPFINFQLDFFMESSEEMKKFIEEKYNIEEKKEIITAEEYYDKKGYIYTDKQMPPDEYGPSNHFNSFDGKSWSMHPTQQKYLEKIIALCEENNAKLIFVTAPIAITSFERIKNYDFVHQEISNFAAKNKIDYYDYNLINQSLNLLIDNNFQDDAHLNHSGVEIVNKHFINILKTYLN